MPPIDVGVDKGSGVYEIRVAPSLPTRLYMAFRELSTATMIVENIALGRRLQASR